MNRKVNRFMPPRLLDSYLYAGLATVAIAQTTSWCSPSITSAGHRCDRARQRRWQVGVLQAISQILWEAGWRPARNPFDRGSASDQQRFDSGVGGSSRQLVLAITTTYPGVPGVDRVLYVKTYDM